MIWIRKKDTRTKHVLNDEMIKQFRNTLSSKLTNEYVNIFSGRILDNSINVNDLLSDLNNVIKSSAFLLRETCLLSQY